MAQETDNISQKTKERKWAEDFAARIKNDPDPTIKYKDFRPITDLKDMLETSCEKFAENTAFWVKDKRGGEYRQVKYKEALSDVNGLGTALIAAGFKDRRIGVVGENSYRWAVSYLAAVCGCGVVVPLDKELSESELKNIIKQADVSCVIFDGKFEQTFRNIKADGDTMLDLLISMDAENSSKEMFAWKDLVESGRNMVLSGNRDFTEAEINPEDMAIILFTSGTTGVSKGVMLSHRNMAAVIMMTQSVILVRTDDIFFSLLPLHHTYECTCGFLIPLYKGASIAYCEGLKYIVKNLGEAKPTIFLGVPAVFENLYKKIWQSARKSGKEDKLKKAMRINVKVKKIGIDLGGMFFKEIRALLGGRMRLMISGGAAINPEVLDGLAAFGIIALQGYGLTEAAPLGALNPDTRANSRSIGRKLPAADIKIDSPDEEGVGEICLKGENIMLGYYGRQDLTDEVLKNGWFYTGDLGYMDKDGYVYLTGRKKNVIIAKNGKNVYPEELEYHLSKVPFIQESMVWSKPSEDGEDIVIVATIVINDEMFSEMTGGAEMTDEEIVAELWKEVDKINLEVPYFKRIKSIVLRKEEFEKNSSKKIKRFAEGNKE